MPNDMYSELRNKAIAAATKEKPKHSQIHIFSLGLILLLFSLLSFYLLNTIEKCINSSAQVNGQNNNSGCINCIIAGWISNHESSAKLIETLTQLATLQLLFLSIAIFYKSLISLLDNKEPDNFPERIIDVIRDHLNPSPSKKDIVNHNNLSTIWISLALAVTVNISVKISNIFESNKINQSTIDSIKSGIQRIDDTLTSQQTTLNTITATVTKNIEPLVMSLQKIGENLGKPNAGLESALTSLNKVMSNLETSINNFDGINVTNYSAELKDNQNTQAQAQAQAHRNITIENKIAVDNPSNLIKISEIDDRLDSESNRSNNFEKYVIYAKANEFCRKNNGFWNFAMSLINVGDSRQVRIFCKRLKSETPIL